MGRRAALVAAAVLTLMAAAVPASAATASWSDRLADVPGAAALAGGGRGVTVAVLDTWVDVTHPDFEGRVDPGVTCAQGRCTPGADRPDACDPHGTHVAGIVASTRYGVAPLAKVLPIRVLTSRTGVCAADAADVALGIRYAIAHHVKIINVSLGSTFPLEDPQGSFRPRSRQPPGRRPRRRRRRKRQGDGDPYVRPGRAHRRSAWPRRADRAVQPARTGRRHRRPGRRPGRRGVQSERLRRLDLAGRRLRLGRRHLDGSPLRQWHRGAAAVAGSAAQHRRRTQNHPGDRTTPRRRRSRPTRRLGSGPAAAGPRWVPVPQAEARRSRQRRRPRRLRPVSDRRDRAGGGSGVPSSAVTNATQKRALRHDFTLPEQRGHDAGPKNG